MSLADNIVFEADLNTDICRVIGFYEAGSLSSYCYCCQIGDYFLAAPSAINDFIVMDKEYRWKRIPVEDRIGKFKIQADLKTWTVFGNDHYAWKAGFTYPAILKADLENGKVEYVTNWLKDVENKSLRAETSAYFGNGYFIQGEKLILPLFCCPGLLELNMNSYDYELHMFDSKYIGFRTLSGDNEFWIETIQGSVICISKEWEVRTQIDNLDIKTFGPFAGGYWKPVLTDTTVFLFPYYSTGIVEIDRITYEVTRSELNWIINGEEIFVDMTSEVEVNDNKLYFFANYSEGNDFFVYDLKSKMLEKHVFVIDEPSVRRIIAEKIKFKEIIKESYYSTVSCYIQEIVNG